MESKHQTPSVILKLMGLGNVYVPPQHAVRLKQKVLSENYLQKVASIGVRKRRSSHQHHSSRMSTDEKEESDYVLKVVKTIKRDKDHNPSKGYGKENPYLSGIKLKSVNSAMRLQQKMNNELQNDVPGETGLYEAFRPSKPQLNLKDDDTFNSRISEAENKTLELKVLTEKLLEVQEHGYLCRQSGFCNDKVKRNIRSKVGANYNFARKVPMDLCEASVVGDNCGTVTKDYLFQKYWGLRKNASVNWSTRKLKNQNINQKDCSEDMNPRSSSANSPSFSSDFSSNRTEENCIVMHKLKNRCCRSDWFHKDPMLLQFSKLIKERENDKHENSNMSRQIAASPDSSVDCLVSGAKTKVVVRSHNNRTKQQSESTASILSHQDNDAWSHTSNASTQQDTSELQEDSVYSLFSGADKDSLGSFKEAYKPSPISVLDPSFSEGNSFTSECVAGLCDSSEVDDEGLSLNVSSDEECENESVGNFGAQKDIVGLSRTEESRDFSYVVEVLTEAGTSNRKLFTDFSTWHSVECPISPSVFEILEKKFGEQQLWKRSERRLLFDRINLGLLEILQPCLYLPMWEKPVSRRLNAEPSQDMIQEEMWGLLVAEEKKAGMGSVDDMLGGEIRWIELGEDVEDIVKEIVKLLIEELVSLENFENSSFV